MLKSIAQNPDIGPPNLFDSFTEAARTSFEFLQLRLSQNALLKKTPTLKERPIIVLPGFLAADWTTSEIRKFLAQKGQNVYGWDAGMNTGPSHRILNHLKNHLDEIYDVHNGQKVTLIGHSLGGVFARELAKNFAEKIEQVITLGSPFRAAHHPQSVAPIVRLVFDTMNGNNHAYHKDKPISKQAHFPPPVPTTSIFSKSDGVVNWQTCLNPRQPRSENIEVYGSHCGLVFNKLAMIVIADRLFVVQDRKKWKPFNIVDDNESLFPSQDHYRSTMKMKHA